MLKVEALSVNYGAVRALDGVDFTLEPGRVLAVLGRNGSGRSTLARALMGLVPGRGRVQWRGRDLLGLAPHAIARCGVGYVPETRDVFALLEAAGVLDDTYVFATSDHAYHCEWATLPFADFLLHWAPFLAHARTHTHTPHPYQWESTGYPLRSPRPTTWTRGCHSLRVARACPRAPLPLA
jgi:hypothetical protein